jgi:hypothetical protein
MGQKRVRSKIDKLKISKVENLGKGVHYIKILKKMYPKIFKKSKKKIFTKPNLEYEYIENLTLVQKVFFEIKVKKDLDIQKVEDLIRWRN